MPEQPENYQSMNELFQQRVKNRQGMLKKKPSIKETGEPSDKDVEDYVKEVTANPVPDELSDMDTLFRKVYTGIDFKPKEIELREEIRKDMIAYYILITIGTLMILSSVLHCI